MFTIFSVPKSFKGKFKTIQQNAIGSWKHIADDIILFGNDKGVGKTAKTFDVRHIPNIEVNKHGTPILSDIFSKAKIHAKHDVLAYVNTDVILFDDFPKAIKQVAFSDFFLIGKRRNIQLDHRVVFKGNWQQKLKTELKKQGRDKPVGNSSEFFVFPKSVHFLMPDFAAGRLYWDSWFIYESRRHKIPVINATPSVFYLHQIHDYSHHKQGFDGVWYGEEAKKNLRLSGGAKTRFKVTDANYLLTKRGLEKPPLTVRSFVRSLFVKSVLNPRLAFIYFPMYLIAVFVFKTIRFLYVLPHMNIKRIIETLKNPGLLEYKLKEL